MELKPVRTDDQQPGRGVTYESTQDVAATAPGRRVLRNTYLLLAASLVPTAIGAVLGTNLDLSFLHASPIIASFAILGIFAELCKRNLPLLPYENEVSDRESRVDLALISKASARQILERKIGMAIRRLDP